MSNVSDLIIIGSGPAGLTAAIYAARANLKPLIFSGFVWGGQLMNTTEVENYPGFPKGILGPDLMQNFREQALRFGAEIVERDISHVELGKQPMIVNDGKQDYMTKSIIVATGATPRKLNIPGEDRLWSKGVSSCATCDGAFFRDRVVAVVGGGDSAMEEATFLTRYASKVYLIHRRGEFRASPIMLERVKENDKITIMTDTVVAEVVGDQFVTGLQLEHKLTGKQELLAVDGVFLGIGHVPASAVFTEAKVKATDLGYLVATDHTMSNLPGVFIAGDVHDHRYRQAITAAAEGCKAAIDAQKWLAGEWHASGS